MARQLITKQLEFEMTNQCNAACLFCPRHDPRPKGYIDVQTIQAGIRLAKAAGIKTFKISGFGEPLLHPKLVEHLKLIKNKIPDALFLLITNGSLLKPELFESLAGIPVTRINISFNGYDQASYEKLMRGLNYDQVMENLKYIAAHNNGRIEIQFIPVMSKMFGQAEIAKMAELLTGLGFTKESLQLHHIITGRSEKLTSKDLIDDRFIEELEDIKIDDKSKVVCLANLSTLYISWQGDIHLCCNDIYGEAVIGKIGDIKTLADLLRLEAKNVELRSNYTFPLCQKCDTPLTAPHEEKEGRIFTRFS